MKYILLALAGAALGTLLMLPKYEAACCVVTGNEDTAPLLAPLPASRNSWAVVPTSGTTFVTSTTGQTVTLSAEQLRAVPHGTWVLDTRTTAAKP